MSGAWNGSSRSAQIWSQSLETADRRWAEAGKAQAGQIAAGLGEAMEFALRRYGERLAEMEHELQKRSQSLLDGLSHVAKAMEETSRQHRDGLAEITQRLGAQTESLVRLQEGETQLVRLQESLQQNLHELANAGAFDEAVQSLTAAIHLLTSRAQPNVTRKAA